MSNINHKCIIPACDRKIKIIKHKLCWMHYIRLLKKGTPGKDKIKEIRKIEPFQLTAD